MTTEGHNNNLWFGIINPLSVLRVREWLKDRPQLSVVAGITVATFPGAKQPQSAVVFQCVNNGKAPITVTDWGHTSPHKG